MATSTNYGWAEPDNSSLVKNGASDIRTLGNAIDTSVWNVGFGQAGKNKIINGNFNIWQRGTSFNAATLFYTADRWQGYSYSGSSQTVSQQSFTVGTAPVAGYESQYFLRATATNTGINIEQRIEDVRTFAGQTVTLSYWAKSNSAQTITTYVNQNFGSGGSSQVTAITGTQAITTSWTRYTLSGTVTSITGKTIGTSSYLQVNFVGATINNALDIWGVQLEYGSVATPFQTASGGSPQAELAMCQRYFNRIADFSSGGSNSQQMIVTAQNFATTGGFGVLQYPVMRTTPSVTFSGNTDFTVTGVAGNNIATTAMAANSIKPNSCEIRYTVTSGVIAGNASLCYTTASTGKLDLSAEL